MTHSGEMAEAEESEPAYTPRINGGMFPLHLGKTVRLVGKVDSVADSGEVQELMLKASDERVVRVIRDQGVASPNSGFVEIVGNVQSEDTIQEILLVEFGDSFGLGVFCAFHSLLLFLFSFFFFFRDWCLDLAAYDQCVRLINGPFRDLFM
jgi:hypothetical protein